MSVDTHIVTINLGVRSYDIYIGSGLLFRFADFVPFALQGRKTFIITDSNVEGYAKRIEDALGIEGVGSVDTLVLEPGEQTKSFANVKKITDWLLSNNIDRDSLIVALGGGVIGDITGFCASIILRGVPYIQVPTSLLAQVDSSVGGKTGINTQHGKNLVGAFYQPVAVIADVETLKSLPVRELMSGYSEIVKYGVIRDSSFFNWLTRNGADVCNLEEAALSYAIEESIKAKAQIVEADETEQGQRALLNFGHTFGHALEAVAGYNGRLLHGEAVAIGMVIAMDLSVRLGYSEREDLERLESHLTDIGLPTRASYIQPPLTATLDELITIMHQDKKVENGKMRFVLANGIGDTFLEKDVPENLVRQVLKDSLGASNDEKVSVMRSFGSHGVRGLWKSVFSSHS